MAQVYFHYTSPEGALLDRRGANVDNITDARDCATGVVQSLITAPSAEDWREWVLHVSDELGEELFIVPFATVIGKPH